MCVCGVWCVIASVCSCVCACVCFPARVGICENHFVLTELVFFFLGGETMALVHWYVVLRRVVMLAAA